MVGAIGSEPLAGGPTLSSERETAMAVPDRATPDALGARRPGSALSPPGSGPGAADDLAPGRWRALLLLCAAVALALTTWFSATAILPEMEAHFGLDRDAAAWLTNGVQIGFVLGALVASLVNLPDIVRLDRLMAAAALLAAAANAVLLLEPGTTALVAARIVAGIALAGVYPPAMKMVATWFRRGRGFALGALIGALTFGSALPHLFRALSASLPWQAVVAASSLAALAGAVLFIAFAREGPFPFSRARFDPRQMGTVLRDRPVRLATFGYLGHMWELYAMWAWILVYVREALAAQGSPSPAAASWIAFLAVAAGAFGCLGGGLLSDRIGRSRSTALLMVISGACAVAIGFAFGGPSLLFVAIALVWGITIIGDSAQFSTAVTELSDPRYVGTALSLQVGLGFGLTILIVWLVPEIAHLLGDWRFAFAWLAIGPFLGAAAMLRLRRLPESARMAGGRR